MQPMKYSIFLVAAVALAGCQQMPWVAQPPAKPIVVKPVHKPVNPVVTTSSTPVVVAPSTPKVTYNSTVTTPAPAVKTTVPNAPLLYRPAAATGQKLADGRDTPAVQGLLASADSELQQGRLDIAVADLERAQRLAPQSAAVYQKLAETRLAQGRAAEAEQMARKGLAYATTAHQQLALWRVLAAAADKQGKADLAQQARERIQLLEQGNRG